MANLIRLNGEGGVELYSSEHFTLEEAKEAYVDECGYEATKIDEFAFDMCSMGDLVKFCQFGNE